MRVCVGFFEVIDKPKLFPSNDSMITFKYESEERKDWPTGLWKKYQEMF